MADITGKNKRAEETHYVSINDDGTQQPNYNNDGATEANAVAIGAGANAAEGAVNIAAGEHWQGGAGKGAVAIGYGAEANKTSSFLDGGAIAIGQKAKAGQMSVAVGGTAVGSLGATAHMWSVAVGGASDSRQEAVAVGWHRKAPDRAVTVGSVTLQDTKTTGDAAVEVGFDSWAGGREDVAIGSCSTTLNVLAPYLNSDPGVAATHSGGVRAFAVGGESRRGFDANNSSPGYIQSKMRRQIQGVAAGSRDDDAVNVAQLKAAVDANGVQYFSVRASDTDGTAPTDRSNINNDAAYKADSLAIGRSVVNDGQSTIVIGDNTGAAGDDSVIIGTTAGAASPQEIILGAEQVAIGNLAGHGSGINASTGSLGTDSVSFGGVPSTATGGNTVIGVSAGWKVNGFYNSNIGNRSGSLVTGSNNTAVGRLSQRKVSGHNNIAVGRQSQRAIKGNNNIAIGFLSGTHLRWRGNYNPRNDANNSFAVTNGMRSFDEARKTDISDTVSIGYQAFACNENAVAIGRQAIAGEYTDSNTAVGLDAFSQVAIGDGAFAKSNSSVSIGKYSRSQSKNAVSIGSSASAEEADSVALGSDSVANRFALSTPVAASATPSASELMGEVYTPADVSTAIKTAVTNTAQQLRSPLSIGDSTGATPVTRQINNVAAGTLDSDAVNIAQLKAAVAAADAGAVVRKIRVIPASATVVQNDDYSLVARADNTTVTMPTAASSTGRVVRILNQNINYNVTLSQPYRDYQNAVQTQLGTGQWVELQSDGTSWFAIGAG